MDSIVTPVAEASGTANLLLAHLDREGYPFAMLKSEICSTQSGECVRFEVDSGPKIDSVRFRIQPTESVPSRLLSRPLGGSVAFYRPNLLADVPSLLESNSYISLATTRVPMVDTTIRGLMVVPVDVTIRRSLFVDGAVSWSSTDNRGFVGDLDLDLINLFRNGESVSFQFYGDKQLQKADISLAVPWVFDTPFLIRGAGSIEVLREKYGRLEGSGGVGYRIGGLWECGFAGRYYELSDSLVKRTFAGVTVTMDRYRPPLRAGAMVWGTKLSAGSGVLRDGASRMPRSDFSASGEMQVPLNRRFAVGIEGFAGAVAVSTPEQLHRTEKIRVGGSRSVRGYTEQEKSFVGVGLARTELRFYFSETGSIFLLGDPAFGVPVHFLRDEIEYLFGYGAGVRIPAGKMNVAVIWARHFREGSGAGRIHVGIRN